MSWFKRRTPTPEPTAIDVEVDDIQFISNHECKMIATYDDGEIYHLSARMHHNPIKDTWTVQGLDEKGHSVVADITEI